MGFVGFPIMSNWLLVQKIDGNVGFSPVVVKTGNLLSETHGTTGTTSTCREMRRQQLLQQKVIIYSI